MEEKPARASKITIPTKAHPFVRLVFAELKRQAVTYFELEMRSGVLTSTMKAWRVDNRPGLETVEACLGALGWHLVPVPDRNHLTQEQRDALESISEHFRSDDEVLGSAILAAAEFPARVEAELAYRARRRASAPDWRALKSANSELAA